MRKTYFGQVMAALAGLCVSATVSVTVAAAADFSDPDWPCIQRKVLHLSTGQMWAGDPVTPEDLKDWRTLDTVAAAAPVLAVRRTSPEEIETVVDRFASDAGADKDDHLRLLFAGVFTLIERERSQIIQGIARYARTQTALTGAIEATQNEITQLGAKKDKTFDDEDRIEELEDQLIWDTRIYKDRQQSLTYVCETPVILEKRAFAIARAIMARLD